MTKKFYFFIAFLLSSSVAFGQTATLRGIITDDKTKDPLPGATIHFDEHNNAVAANVNGEYSILNISPGEYKVKVKLLGYTEFEKKIKLAAGQELILDIKLSREDRQLETVNVYGTINKETDAASRSTEKNAK